MTQEELDYLAATFVDLLGRQRFDVHITPKSAFRLCVSSVIATLGVLVVLDMTKQTRDAIKVAWDAAILETKKRHGLEVIQEDAK